MITLKRDNIVMEVATELQASVFLRAGYVRVDKAELAAETVKAETAKEEPAQEAEAVPEKPKRRRRTAKQA